MTVFGSCYSAFLLFEGSKATDVATEPLGLRHPKPMEYTWGQDAFCYDMSRWQFRRFIRHQRQQLHRSECCEVRAGGVLNVGRPAAGCPKSEKAKLGAVRAEDRPSTRGLLGKFGAKPSSIRAPAALPAEGRRGNTRQRAAPLRGRSLPQTSQRQKRGRAHHHSQHLADGHGRSPT